MTFVAPATARLTIALHKLPVQLRMLVRLLGEAAAYQLVQWRGGTPYTVPVSVHSRQFGALVDGVGAEAAMAVVAELGGQTLELPKYDGVTRQLRHQQVIELRVQRLTHVEIALATGYGVRQVINICNQARLTGLDDAMGAQGDFFAADGVVSVDDDAGAAVADGGPAAHNPFGLLRGRNGRMGAKPSKPGKHEKPGKQGMSRGAAAGRKARKPAEPPKAF